MSCNIKLRKATRGTSYTRIYDTIIRYREAYVTSLTKLNNLRHRRSVQKYTIYRIKYICYRRIISANLADFSVRYFRARKSERKEVPFSHSRSLLLNFPVIQVYNERFVSRFVKFES